MFSHCMRTLGQQHCWLLGQAGVMWPGSRDRGGDGKFGRPRSSQPVSAHAPAGHWSEPEERRGRPATTSNMWILQRRRGRSVHWAWETVWWSQLDTRPRAACSTWSLHSWNAYFLFFMIHFQATARYTHQIYHGRKDKWYKNRWNDHRLHISWTQKPKVHVSAQGDSRVKVLFPWIRPRNCSRKREAVFCNRQAPWQPLWQPKWEKYRCWFLYFQTGSHQCRGRWPGGVSKTHIFYK